MRTDKKAATFLLSVAALILLLFSFANDTVTDWVKSASGGSGNTDYYQLTAATDGAIWALGRRNDVYELACGSLNGGDWRGKLNMDALPERFLPEDLYAVSSKLALLSGYQLNADGEPVRLLLYAVSDQGKTLKPLLNNYISGDTEQEKTLRFSTFSHYEDKVRFLMADAKTCYLYEMNADDLSLRMAGSFACPSWKSALILKDKRIAVAKNEGVISFYSDFGEHLFDLRTNGTVSALYAGTDSFYYLDAAAKAVNEVGELNGEYYVIQKIPADSSLPLNVQPGGTTLWLENGRLFHYDGAPVPVSGILYRAPRESIAILVLCAIAVLVLAGLTTMLLCSRIQVSFLIRAAMVMAALILSSVGVMRSFFRNETRNAALEQARQGVETAASLGLELSEVSGSEAAPTEMAEHILHAMESSGYFDTRVTLYRYDDHGFFVVMTTDPDIESGTVVSGNGLLLKARPSGTVSELDEVLSGPVCRAVASAGQYLLFVETNLSAVRDQGVARAQKLTNRFFAVIFSFAFILFFLLVRIWAGIGRLRVGMDLVSTGEYDLELKNDSGDELEGLARSMNDMTRVLREERERGKQISENYMRFIPEETIQLLGVDRLEDVTRETVASHRMAVMTVRFTLPEEDISTELLFRDINTVIQRTIFAAVAYAGNSFNFTHDGYNVVFTDEYMEMAFHAALAIKEAADAVNKEREFEGRAPVHLCIAMDCGLVQMGIVGDELHMVPAAVSRCLEKNEQMLRLCKMLDAGILLTDEMVPFGDDCNFRYVGNFASESGTEKLYELYDGDSYLISQRKRDTQEEFDQAIRAFYQSDFKTAKTILLQLVRTGSSRDGSACYYLNKADLYEQHPPKALLLRGEEY